MKFKKSKITAKDFLGIHGKITIAIGSNKYFNHQDAVKILGPENSEYGNGEKIWLFDYKNQTLSVEYNHQLLKFQIFSPSKEIAIEFRKEILNEFKKIDLKKWEEGFKASKHAIIPGWKYDSTYKLSENMFQSFSRFFNQSHSSSITNDQIFQNKLYTMEISIWKYGRRGVDVTISKQDKTIWERKTNNLNQLRDIMMKAEHMLRSIGLVPEHVRTIKKLNGKIVDEIDDYNEEVEIKEARRPGTFSRTAPNKRYGLKVGEINDLGDGKIEIILPRNDLETRKKLLKPLIDKGYKMVNTVKNMKMDIVTLRENVEELNESKLSNDDLTKEVHRIKQHMINKGIVRPDDQVKHIHKDDQDAVIHGIIHGTNTKGFQNHLKTRKLNEDVEELDEYVLNAQQRRKRGLIMKRFKTKIKLARERKAKRVATNDQLMIRARKVALQMLRKRFAGKMGADYGNLTVSQKIQVDKRIESKKKLVAKLAKRILPKIRQKEIARYRSKIKHDAASSETNANVNAS